MLSNINKITPSAPCSCLINIKTVIATSKIIPAMDTYNEIADT